MPRTRASVRATDSAESEEPQEKVVIEPEEDLEDDVEYEEIEEEVEEEEEIEEEVLEEEDGEGEGEGAEAAVAGSADAITCGDDEVDIEKQKEFLALPPHGSEVYIGGIPSTASYEDLRQFCGKVGEVVEVRMITGKDKVYAFVSFRTKELAKEAIEILNNTEFKGKKIKCSTSQAKNKLFIGNVPRNWVEEDVKNAVSKTGPGVIGVQLMKDPQNSNRNRGFAFIEYYNHACAEYSRKKMSTPKFKLGTNAPTVSWADPKSGDSGSAAQIKSVYVKNLPKTATEAQLKKLFERHGKITKVVLPNVKSGQEHRIGFVHFAERSTAMKALQNTEIYELDGQVLECSLAKPPADKKLEAVADVKRGALLQSYPLQPGLLGGAYGALPTGFPQHMPYGAGSAAGVAMVPMILPDGRLGYVLQQPGVPVAAIHPGGVSTGQHGGSRGKSSGGHQQGADVSRGHRYRPY
ncbi:hypothetical protein HPP92_002816 [Vanilla planifolia]|uniref:RRM domain-containing protein n=1 Tax=Vanilla planifolia TaxID=51239 RepID=A0A835RT88_VANPL|nr:hypothetical protein HPP92_002816 [Vanilla planifolia]